MMEEKEMMMAYTMGNYGDLIKHGVLIQTLDWLAQKTGKVSYADPFGGRFCAEIDNSQILERLNQFGCLQDAWDGKSVYYGSGHIATNKGADVFVSDRSTKRRNDLRASGLRLLDDKLSGYDNQNGYCILKPEFAREFNLVLIDPLGDFLPRYAGELDNVRKAAEANPEMVIIVFVLDMWWKNQKPDGSAMHAKHRRFMEKRKMLSGLAYSLHCPVIRGEYGRRNNEKYEKEVLVVSAQIASGNCEALRQKLSDFAEEATNVLCLQEEGESGKKVEFEEI